MKEHPILFSAPMVRAILASRKTRTRRVVRWPEWTEERYREVYAADLSRGHAVGEFQDGRVVRVINPAFAAGDKLWVRETWKPVIVSAAADGYERACTVEYAADGARVEHRCGHDNGWKMVDLMLQEPVGQWRPSIFLPRWASRLSLVVESVRVERLQSITDEEASAEGVDADNVIDGGYAINAFARLWDSINGRRPGCAWGANPWVWSVGFRVEVP